MSAESDEWNAISEQLLGVLEDSTFEAYVSVYIFFLGLYAHMKEMNSTT